MGKLSLLFLGLLMSISLWAQRTITGRVTDANGAPLSGVTVTVRGTNTATQTQTDGSFSISAAQGSTLVFTSVGFTLQEVPVGASDNLTITLQNQNRELTEVVVTALGQTRSKERLGYASSSFRSEEITRAAPVSALDGLQGRVAGADISTIGGQPGSSSKIILRGYTSLSTTGNNQALIVVDGVPFNNSRIGSFNDFLNSGGADFGNGLNDLNPNDIESINILKGAAATSLYGSRAANGVVIVTTKRGRSGKLTVDFTSSAMFSEVAKLPETQDIFGQGWNSEHWKEENGSWGPKMDGKQRLWGSVVDNSRLIKPFSPVEDNVRDFYDLGKEFNNTISLRGGNENANFYFSYGNVRSNGILPEDVDVYNRNTLSLRGQMKSDKFIASASLNYINKYGSNATSVDDAAGSSTFDNIIQIPRDIKITDLKDYNNKFFNVDNYYSPYNSNPYYSLFENGNTHQNDRVFGNVELGYDFSKALNLRWKTGVDVADARVKDWQAVEKPNPNTWRGDPSTNDEATGLDPFLLGGVRDLSEYVREVNSDFFVNFNKDISVINVSGFIGGNYNDRESRLHESRVVGLTIPGYYSVTNSSNDVVTILNTFKRRLFGAYAQGNFAYKDFAFLSVNARNDWSSTLPKGKNSYFYPGVNASLIVSKLIDLEAAKISYLKLRGAYGKTGKDAPVYSLRSVGVAGSVVIGFGDNVFPMNGVSGFEVGNTIGNTSLKPELTTEYEFGGEIRFLDNRIGIDATYYNKRTKGQILNVPIAASTGYTSLIANFGLMENKGVELVATVSPVRSKNFNWTINYSFTRNRNRVLELPAGLDKVDFNSYFDVSMVARVGEPVGVIEAPKKVMTDDGRYVVDANGYFLDSPDDQIYGNIARDYMMGLNNNFSYKNWSLGFSLDYRRGGVFVSRTADLMSFTGNAWMTAYNDRRPFIIPNSVIQSVDANGDPLVDGSGKPVYEENTILITPEKMDNYWYQDNAPNSWENIILPKDFLKLRDVTLSYRLPTAWSSKVRAQNIVLSAIARNFLLWTPQKNTTIDPEITNLGNDFIGEFGEQAGSATTKAYGVSLRVNF
jgi:TonB-linked SusC/RagA family outer membrane protein